MQKLVCWLALALLAANAVASDRPAIEGTWIRATPPNASTAAVYLTIRGTDEADRLTGAHTSIADTVEIHTTLERDGVLHMQRVPELPIAPHETVEFAPGAEHLMLIGLKSPLTPGDTVVITLQFERVGAVDVTFAVLDARAEKAGAMHQHGASSKAPSSHAARH